MIKRAYIILLVLFAYGCETEHTGTGKHCYLVSGMYLITEDVYQAQKWAESEKHKWAPKGKVSVVFNYYNKDLTRQIYWEPTDDIRVANRYLAQGYPVVISYDAGEMDHSEPYTRPVDYKAELIQVYMSYMVFN